MTTTKNSARTQPCLSASGKVCYNGPIPQSSWVIESDTSATLTNGLETFQVELTSPAGAALVPSPTATPPYVDPGDAPAVGVHTNGADTAFINLSRGGGFPDSGPYSVYVYDIEDDGTTLPPESVTWTPLPDFVGPVGNGVVTEYRWDDASVLGNTIGGAFGATGTVGQKKTELIVGFTVHEVREAWVFHDCDDPRTPIYFDTVTGEALTDPEVIDCSANEAGGETVRAHLAQSNAAVPWEAADVPIGTLVGMSVTCVTGTTVIVDANDHSTPIPAGYSVEWSADLDGQLVPPTDVVPQAPDGYALIAMTVRP